MLVTVKVKFTPAHCRKPIRLQLMSWKFKPLRLKLMICTLWQIVNICFIFMIQIRSHKTHRLSVLELTLGNAGSDIELTGATR